MITTAATYYSNRTIKDALHACDLTFAEVGIFIFALDANRPITIDDLLLFSPVDGIAVIQPAVNELVRLGFLRRHA